jgi:hypothetical protein
MSMHAHFVFAQTQPTSFNARLVRSGAAALKAQGSTTTVSDLYAMGLDRCERGGVNRLTVVPFNWKAEWGAGGRIAKGELVCSPFIRRRPNTDLEYPHRAPIASTKL